MQTQKVLLADQSYQGRSESATGLVLENLYMEMNPEGSKYPFTLYNTPGLKEWIDLNTNEGVNGLQVMDGNLYAYSANDVFKIDSLKNSSNIGNTTGIAGRLDLCNNGTEILSINSEGDGFLTTSSSVTQIVDADFPVASAGTFIDGFFVVSKQDSGEFYKSKLYDGSDWDALEFATAEEAPDNLVRPYAFNNSLWLFGESSLEPYYNNGDAAFPFAQIQGAANTTRGCAAKFSVTQEDNGLFFLGNDRIAYRIQSGYTPSRISTHALESIWQDYDDVSDAFSFIYTQDGHKFWVLTFPSANATFVFDLATNRWHVRKSEFGRWRPNCHAFFAGKHLVGDYANGKIYELDLNTYTDDGTLVKRVVQGAALWYNAQRINSKMLFLDVDTGVANITGQGSDPYVIMRHSEDGGKTWSNERWSSLGQIGDRLRRAVWRRNGQYRQRLYEFVITDDIPVRITGCYNGDRIGRF